LSPHSEFANLRDGLSWKSDALILAEGGAVGWLLLYASGAVALTSGIDVLTALVWGKFYSLSHVFLFPFLRRVSMAPIDARYEPERFKRGLAISFAVVLFSTLFFLLALFAILNPP
jgi:hypothetical protein